ncbi:MAG: DUF3147 family protein [Gammaproteobacteria bacterium]|nr:DUF3147 family protein [Gammaproteobacteria bacterium]MBV9621027.1 DUF3147 family protein [Gammaproteobacteria bacterium]
MTPYLIKILSTAVLVVAITEVAKRSTFWGAALASLPLTSVLAFVWLYLDTADVAQVATLSRSVFWLVIPSLVLLAALPGLLRSGLGFWASLGGACALTAASYGAMTWSLPRLGIRL